MLAGAICLGGLFIGRILICFVNCVVAGFGTWLDVGFCFCGFLCVVICYVDWLCGWLIV